MNAETTKNAADQLADRLGECVREYPLAAMATSLLGGLCVGVLAVRLVDSALPHNEPSTMERLGRSVADTFGRVVPGSLRSR